MTINTYKTTVNEDESNDLHNNGYSKFLKEYKHVLNSANTPYLNKSEWENICGGLKQNEFEWVGNDSECINFQREKNQLLRTFNRKLEHLKNRSLIISQQLKRIKNKGLNNSQINKQSRELDKLNEINLIEITELQQEYNGIQFDYCWKKQLNRNKICYIVPGYIGIDEVYMNDYYHSDGEVYESSSKSYWDFKSFKTRYIQFLHELNVYSFNLETIANESEEFYYNLLTLEDFQNCLPTYWADIKKDLKQHGFKLEQDHNKNNLYFNNCIWSYVIKNSEGLNEIEILPEHEYEPGLKDELLSNQPSTNNLSSNCRVIYIIFKEAAYIEVNIQSGYEEDGDISLNGEYEDSETFYSNSECTDLDKRARFNKLIPTIIETGGIIPIKEILIKHFLENQNKNLQ